MGYAIYTGPLHTPIDRKQWGAGRAYQSRMAARRRDWARPLDLGRRHGSLVRAEDLADRRIFCANTGQAVLFGPISSIADITTFALMRFVSGANTPVKQTLFQFDWYSVGLLTQTPVVHMIRTQKSPFIQSRAATPLLAMTAVIIAVGIFLPIGPLTPYFKLRVLSPFYFTVLPLILLAYMGLTQALNGIYSRRWSQQ